MPSSALSYLPTSAAVLALCVASSPASLACSAAASSANSAPPPAPPPPPPAPRPPPPAPPPLGSATGCALTRMHLLANCSVLRLSLALAGAGPSVASR